MKKSIPNGYHVFELAHRGCWHWRRYGIMGSSNCYDTKHEAEADARADFERWAAELRSATT